MYDRYSANVYALLLRIIGIPQSAQQALEETFATVREKARLYDPAHRSEFTWVISIARRLAIERLRARPVPSFIVDPLQLAYFEALSPAEISERTGETAESIRSALEAKMKELRQRLHA